jgi:O-antigen ligase
MTFAESPSQPSASRYGLGFWVFCLYTFVLIGRPQDYVSALVPLRLALVFTIVTGLVTVTARREGEVGVFRSSTARLYLLLFVIMCAGIPFALYRRGSFNFVVLTYAANIGFYLMFLAQVDSVARFKRIIIVVTVSILVASVVWYLQGSFRQGRYVSGSGVYDPNDIAFVEVTLLPFAVCVLAVRFRAFSKLVALAVVVLAVMLTLYTASRGGLLGLFTVFVVLMVLPIGGVRMGPKLLILACLIVVGALNADKINVGRFSTLKDLGSDYNLSDENGRAQIWKRGLGLLADNPLTGVGVSCFMEGVGTMRASEGLPGRWVAPHSAYIQILVETGVFGGATFLLLAAVCLTGLNRWRRYRPQSNSDRELADVSGILMAGFLGLLVTGAFLSQAYSIVFTLYFAASDSLTRIAAGTTGDCRVGATRSDCGAVALGVKAT